MAGTLIGISMSQHHNVNGKPETGLELRIYEAGSLTHATAYSDAALTDELDWPITGTSTGRIPSFWLADGNYRARITNGGGSVLLDEDDLPAIGPAAAAASDPTSTTEKFQTGDFLWKPVSGTRTGWVRANGLTIGPAASGATERANADTEDLFSHLWDNYDNNACPVLGGRGATAAADWGSGKTITLPDMRGRSPIGIDGMGNTLAGRITSTSITTGSANSTASVGGAATVTLTTAQVPTHSHSVSLTTSTAAAHNHENDGFNSILANSAGSGTASALGSGSGWANVSASREMADAGEHSHTVSGNTGNAGSGSAHNNMPPFMSGTWWIKL